MSFYNRSGGYGGLVRFPGLNGLVRFPGLGHYGAFGDVSEAQAALSAANAKLAKQKAQIVAQNKLIEFSNQAVKNCIENGPNIFMNVVSGGTTAAFCMAKEGSTLEQRKGVLATLEYDLPTLKADVENAKIALAQAKADALAPPEVDPEPVVTHVDSSGNTVVTPHTSTAKASGASSGGGLSPMMIAAIAIPVLGGLVYVMTRRKAAVGGYRRRRSRR